MHPLQTRCFLPCGPSGSHTEAPGSLLQPLPPRAGAGGSVNEETWGRIPSLPRGSCGTLQAPFTLLHPHL